MEVSVHFLASHPISATMGSGMSPEEVETSSSLRANACALVLDLSLPSPPLLKLVVLLTNLNLVSRFQKPT